ncbi:hypothetical protein MPER_06816 [Moniliophthora perniciosa FA553]|nr:hypothetical protein MPER_06816 [Moniliophthora perniciosa FA553]
MPSNQPITCPLSHFLFPTSRSHLDPTTNAQWAAPIEHKGSITYNEPFVPDTRELMYLIETKQYDEALIQAADNKLEGTIGALMHQALFLNRQRGVISMVINDYEKHIEQMKKVAES